MGHGIVNIGGAPKHASRHASGGADAITPGDIGAAALVHKARHATGGADALAPSDIGAAELVDGVVKPSQARMPMVNIDASITLGAAHAEVSLWCQNSNAIVITIPRDVDNLFPLNCAVHIIRVSAPVSIALEAGVAVLVSGRGWVTSGTAASISAIGESMLLVRRNGPDWWLS